jgi:hypothetical protein
MPEADEIKDRGIHHGKGKEWSGYTREGVFILSNKLKFLS